MGLFGVKNVQVPLERFGPGAFTLPPPELLIDRKAVAAANSVNMAWAHLSDGLMARNMPAAMAFATEDVLPRLPGDLGQGRPNGWSPADPVAVGLAAGWSFPMLPGQ